MKIEELEGKIMVSLKKEPISVSRPTGGFATLSLHKAAAMANRIIELLKEAAGNPYEEGETEEITFGGKTWFLTLEETKEPEHGSPS